MVYICSYNSYNVFLAGYKPFIVIMTMLWKEWYVYNFVISIGGAFLFTHHLFKGGILGDRALNTFKQLQTEWRRQQKK